VSIRREFDQQWGRSGGHAITSYMFNNELDGHDGFLQDGRTAVLSHNDVVQYLLVDGSVHAFRNEPLVYNDAVGPERLQDVSLRYGLCFPTRMLHEWLGKERVNMQDARTFLANPIGWSTANQTRAGAISLADIRSTALVSDVVGVWGEATPDPPSGL